MKTMMLNIYSFLTDALERQNFDLQLLKEHILLLPVSIVLIFYVL